MGGYIVSQTAFKRPPVVINFWATWCLPCREEMPELIDAYQRHKEDGLVILAIDATLQDTREDVAAFVDEFQIPFAVLLDEEGQVNVDYRVLGLPTSFFIDADGVIQALNAGPMDGALLAGYLEQILIK
jgi:thiol-disulfide isomerase/thioredoxin